MMYQHWNSILASHSDSFQRVTDKETCSNGDNSDLLYMLMFAGRDSRLFEEMYEADESRFQECYRVGTAL